VARTIREKGEKSAEYVGRSAMREFSVAEGRHRKVTMILTLGAGIVSQLGPMIVETLQRKRGQLTKPASRVVS